MVLMKYLFVLLFTGIALTAKVDWPDFRGPGQDGRVEAQLPGTWSETENVTWKTALHGHGISTPVVIDQTLALTAATEDGKEMYFLTVDFASGRDSAR